jgi:hypothetical protein
MVGVPLENNGKLVVENKRRDSRCKSSLLLRRDDGKNEVASRVASLIGMDNTCLDIVEPNRLQHS